MVVLGGLGSHFGWLVGWMRALGWPGYIGVDKEGRRERVGLGSLGTRRVCNSSYSTGWWEDKFAVASHTGAVASLWYLVVYPSLARGREPSHSPCHYYYCALPVSLHYIRLPYLSLSLFYPSTHKHCQILTLTTAQLPHPHPQASVISSY